MQPQIPNVAGEKKNGIMGSYGATTAHFTFGDSSARGGTSHPLLSEMREKPPAHPLTFHPATETQNLTRTPIFIQCHYLSCMSNTYALRPR
jgi:hypothetical protein